MLTRLYILVIAIIHVKNSAGSILQNDSYNISGIIANNAGRFQKGLNQISANRAANVQHSLNSLRGASLQQNQHSQLPINSPSSATSMMGSSQSVSPHSALLSSLNGNQAKGLQSILQQQQQQPKMQQLMNSYGANNQFNGNNFEHQNPMLTQQIIQQSPGIPSMNDLSHHPPLIAQAFQGALSDPMLAHAIFQEIPSNIQSNSINPLSDAHNLMYQNLQSMSGVPSYILDRSQSANFMQTPQPLQQYGQSSFNTVVPQRNQHSMDFIQTEMPTVINPGQPSIFSNPSVGFSNHVNSIASQTSVSSPYSTFPSSGSMVSSPYKQELSSSNLQALLPLILNLMQDSNNCNCCQQCGCRNLKNNQQVQQSTSTSRGNTKDGRCGCKQEVTLGNKNSLSGDTNQSTKTSGSRRKQGKTKTVKVEESYEDYDDDDDIGDLDYD